jgi:hypothetical protein
MKTYLKAIFPAIAIGLAMLACKDDPDTILNPDTGGGATLTISSVNPTAGSEGSKVVITGTGFSTSLSNNTVKFGTVVATVDSASATRIVTKVPKDAGTGKLTIEVGGKMATSSIDFTVVTNPPVFGGASSNTSGELTTSTANVSSVITSKGVGAITQHGHVWSKNSNPPTLTDSKSELGPISDKAPFPFKLGTALKNLEANTTYFVRAYIAMGDVIIYGEVFKIKTSTGSAVTMSFTTQQQDILGTTGSTIDIRTFIFAPAGTNLSSYGHVYSSTVSPPTTDHEKTVFAAATIGKDLFAFTSNIKGLRGNTKYNVRPYAIVDGKTYYGNGWTITTTEAIVNILTPVKRAEYPGAIDTYNNTSFVKDGKIYVADGKYTQTAGYKYNYKFYEYNPTSNTWSFGFDYNGGPYLSREHCSAYYKNKWYYFSSSTLSEYDFETKIVKSQEINAAGSASSGSVQFTAIDGKIYFTKNRSLWILDLDTKTVAKLNTIPFNEEVEGLANANGRLYVAGSGKSSNLSETFTIFYEYDITSNAWTKKPDATASNALKLKTYRFRYIKGVGNKVYGFNRWGIGVYDPATNTWKRAYTSVSGDDALEGAVRQVVGNKAYLGLDVYAKYLLEVEMK